MIRKTKKKPLKPTPLHLAFLANVEERLASMGWSHGDLARRMGVSKTQVSGMFLHRRLPTLFTVYRVSEAMDFPADRLLKIKDN